MNGKDIWPLNPKQISNDVHLGFTETGIIPNMYLKGILADMSVSTSFPFTFSEICSGENIITEGDTPRIRHDQVCLLDECNNKECLYYDLNRTEFYNKVSAIKNRGEKFSSQKFKQLLSQYSKLDLESNSTKIIVSDELVVVYKYFCYKNNKLEFLIPIVFDGCLLGLLYVGLISDEARFLLKLEKSLDGFYKILKDEMVKLTHNFVAQKVDDVNTELRNEFYKSKLPKGSERLKRFWSKIQNPLDILRYHFPAKHIIIFAKDTMENSRFDSKFKAVIGSGLTIKHQEFNFDPSRVIKYSEISKSQELNITNINFPSLVNGLELNNSSFNENTDILRLFPSNYSPRSSFVIWVRYDSDNWDRIGGLKRNSKKDELFDKAILSFYSLMGSVYSSVMAEIASELLELTIRVMGHEISQNLIVIEAIRHFKIETGNILNSRANLYAINEDLRSQIMQIEYMDSNARAIVKKDLNIFIEKVHPLKDLIYKWVNTYKRKSRLRKIVFITQGYNPGFYMPFIHTDVLKLDQVVYNVINNAWKYCYKGTNVIINYGVNESDKTKVRLSFVNFGKTIPPSNIDIYDLFVRGDNTSGIEGLGVGLGIAKQYMNLLKGKIFHIADQIENRLSEFNIPVLCYYIDVLSKSSKIDNHKYLESEFDRLVADRNISLETIVCKENGKYIHQPSLEEVKGTINNPTYKIEFIIELQNN